MGCFALRDSQAARTKQREPSSGQVKQRAEEQRGSSSHYARRWKARNARGAHMESLARVSARCVNEKCLETEKEKCIRQDSVGNLLVPISVTITLPSITLPASAPPPRNTCCATDRSSQSILNEREGRPSDRPRPLLKLHHRLETITHMARSTLPASAPPPLKPSCVTERSTLLDCGEERLQRPPSPLLRPHYHCLETINHMAACCTRARRHP